MQAAVRDVREKKMGFLKAVQTHGVPRITLFRLVKEMPNTTEAAIDRPLGRKPLFCKELEQELVSYLIEMESLFHGLTRTEVRRIAFQLAERNNISHPFGAVSYTHLDVYKRQVQKQSFVIFRIQSFFFQFAFVLLSEHAAVCGERSFVFSVCSLEFTHKIVPHTTGMFASNNSLVLRCIPSSHKM